MQHQPILRLKKRNNNLVSVCFQYALQVSTGTTDLRLANGRLAMFAIIGMFFQVHWDS